MSLGSIVKKDLQHSLLLSYIGKMTLLFPLTLQGVITLSLAALTLSVYGYGSMDLVVFSLAICALAIVIFSLFCTVIGGLFIQRRVQKILQQQAGSSRLINLEAGYPNETGFCLPTLNYFPLVKLSWRIVFPDWFETRIRMSPDMSSTEEVIPHKRCRTSRITRRFVVSDVLGFCRYSWVQDQQAECMALPQTNSVKPLPLLRSLTPEDGIPNPSGDPDGDRMDIRPYVPGDSVRNIMWKVYARTRQLNVKLPEKSVFQSNRTIAYLLSSPNDEAAAAVARIALEAGVLGDDWAFAADGTEQPCETLASALDAIAKSRAIGTGHRYGLDKFLSLASGQSGVHCIVFAAAEIAPWLGSLKKTIAGFPGQFSLVIATDGFDDRQPATLWQRLFLRNEGKTSYHQPTGSRTEMLKLLTDLGQLVESTLVVDRKTGFSFDHNLRKV